MQEQQTAALPDETAILRAQLGAHLRRERIMADVCAQFDALLPFEERLSQCMGIIGDAYSCDAVSLYVIHDPPLKISRAAQWTALDRRSTALDAHIASILSSPFVAVRLDADRFFCGDEARQVSDRRLRHTMRVSKTSSVVLLNHESPHAPRILCVIQDAAPARRWDPADIGMLLTIMRVIGQGMKAGMTVRRLEEVEKLNSQIVELAPTAIYSIDLVNRRFISINESMCQATGYSREELAAMDPGELLTPESRQIFLQRLMDMANGRSVSKNIEFQLRTKSGTLEWGHFHIRHLIVDGRVSGANVVAHIITEQKRAQEELARYGRQLEALVENRTSELTRSNQQLRKEVERHTQTAVELRKQSERLTEMNTAMRVLLDKRNEERIRTEENIRLTLKELIEPYLQRLENSGLGRNQRQLIDLIRLNLEEVVGSSLPEISSAFLYFSPSELQIVNLIRKGKSTKEMAILLNISPRTVEAYRNNVRRKLGLKNRKVNLRTFLSSFK